MVCYRQNIHEYKIQWNKNIIIQIEINVNDGSIKYENEFEQNYMKVKDRIYKLYTENPGFYNHIIQVSQVP